MSTWGIIDLYTLLWAGIKDILSCWDGFVLYFDHPLPNLTAIVDSLQELLVSILVLHHGISNIELNGAPISWSSSNCEHYLSCCCSVCCSLCMLRSMSLLQLFTACLMFVCLPSLALQFSSLNSISYVDILSTSATLEEKNDSVMLLVMLSLFILPFSMVSSMCF